MSVAHSVFSVFADGDVSIGLAPGDAIDALILSDKGRPGQLDPKTDEALFSLDPTSTSGVPGAIYYTDFNRPFDPSKTWRDPNGSLFAVPGTIGLEDVDNLNADWTSFASPRNVSRWRAAAPSTGRASA